MRVLAAVISSFFLASIFPEHPKLFARADVLDISNWAGVRKTATTRYRAVVTAFRIPTFGVTSDDTASAAFLGITLGSTDSRDCVNSASVSAGLMVYFTAGGLIFRPVFQYYPEDLRTVVDGRRVAETDDFISIFIVVLGGGLPPFAVITNWTKLWKVRIAQQAWPGWSICEAVAEWKVGRIRASGVLGHTNLDLVNFDNIVFRHSFVVNNDESYAAPGGDSSVAFPMELPGHWKLEATVNPADRTAITFAKTRE